MNDKDNRRDPLVTNRIHPAVFKTAVGFALWMLIAAWGFSESARAAFALTVVSFLILAAIGLPLLMWRISQRRRALHRSHDERSRFGDWLSGEIEIWQGRLKGSEAAAGILMPIAAAAIGMTALALVLHLTTAG